MAVHVLTDKTPTKQLPCTFPGCEDEVVVTKFYTPSKARCPEHSGKATPAARAAVGTQTPTDSGRSAARRNPGQSVASPGLPSILPDALAGLLCPFDGQPLTIAKVDDWNWPFTLTCAHCLVAIVIKPKWAGMVIPNVHKLPEPLRQLIQALNLKQKALQLPRELVDG